ncbi:MAG: transcription termination factor Rho, partial [Planctomycetota bacterium]
RSGNRNNSNSNSNSNNRGRRSGGGGGNRQERNDTQNVPEELLERRTGQIEIMKDGFGFLRFPENYFLPNDKDVYVPTSLVRKYRIRSGSIIEGDVAPARKRTQKPTLHRVLTINAKDPELHDGETPFKSLVACDPHQKFELETSVESDISMRIVDLLTPIGFGQRALIVAPPRTGKTVIMQKMANAIAASHPQSKVIVLLIDERPEEVTDFKRSTTAEVVASCLDEGTANHVRVTEMVLEKLKRQVEAGHDVVCLLDSITRLGRAYNNETKHSGRILSGGVDAKTLAKPKAFFGAARKIENGGSLTIIATALIETGSRMDQVIFEEFKGTGNMELILSRKLANNRVFPAIDITASGTRKEEKLLTDETLRKVTVLRRVLNQLKPTEAMTLLVERMEKTECNDEFLAKFDVGS